MILNIGFESSKLLYFCRHRLLGQTVKQPLSNFEPQTASKYKQLRGLKPDPSCLSKKQANCVRVSVTIPIKC